jgi:hypothetical protein
VQQQAIQEILGLPGSDQRGTVALQLLMSWRIMIVGSEASAEEDLMAALSQAYVEWEQKTKAEGIQIGKQEGIREANQKAVLGLSQLGLPVDQIPQGLGLDPEVVQDLINSTTAD